MTFLSKEGGLFNEKMYEEAYSACSGTGYSLISYSCGKSK
jgi:hypothetical protein